MAQNGFCESIFLGNSFGQKQLQVAYTSDSYTLLYNFVMHTHHSMQNQW